MRNYYFISAMVGLLLMGCSVDNDETSLNNDQIKTANSVWEVDGCESMVYEFHSSLGEFIITNDNDNLYLNFLANDGFSIYDIRWEVMPSEADLPINANGINSSRLDQRDKFDSGVAYHGETLPISDFGVDPGYVIVAAEVILKNSLDQKFTAWVGNESDFKNGSNYLVYNICDPLGDPVCSISAGSDKSVEYSFEYVDNFVDDLSDISTLYLNLLDEGVPRNGVLSPTIRVLRDQFYKNPYGDFIATYTISVEEDGFTCSDSVELIITVIP